MTEHLSENADLYKNLFNLFPDAVFLEAKDGTVIECNEKALEVYGYTKEEMIGLKARDLIHEQAAATFPDGFDEDTTTEGVFVWISGRKKNGTIFPIQYSNQIITIKDRQYVLAFVRDVSEHYWRKHYLHHNRNEQIPWSNQGIPVLSLTWERRGDTFVLIGFDDRALTTTNDRIQNYIGKSIHEVYAGRPDILMDFSRCHLNRSIIRRKTIYRLFTTGQELIAELTYVFIPSNLIIMHVEDFTERDSAEALNQSLVKSSPAGLSLVQDGRFSFTNPKLQECTGYGEHELGQLDPYLLVHPDDRHLMRDLLDRIHHIDLAGKPIEMRLIRKDGGTTWAMVTATSIFYRHKQAVLIKFLDMTELKQARQKLDEITSLQSSIMAAIPHAVIGLEDRSITFANHAVESLFGWKPHELIGKSMRVLFRSDQEFYQEGRKFYSQLESKQTFSMEFTYRHKEGSDVVCLTSVSRIDDATGGAGNTRLVATHTDITEKRRAEERLQESQRVLSTLIGNLPGMAYRRKPGKDWPVEFISEGSFDLTGYRSADLVDSKVTSYRQLIHPNDRKAVWQKVKESLKAGEHFEMMYRIIRADRKVRWVWERGMGIYSPSGKIVAVEGLITDVTEYKEAQQELEQSRRQLSIHAEHLHVLLEGVRTEIAREIHDELGQILSALKMDLFWLSRKVLGESAEVIDKIQSMMLLIDSTIKTVERILVTLRPSMLDELGLTTAIEWLGEEFQGRTGIVCEAILEPAPERLITDEKISTALFRICQEALTNITRHARATGVQIVLRTVGGQIELKVSDNGIGISKQDIKKSDSFGILGIRERVNLLGGRMNIAGRKGKGTVLRVRIPLRDIES